MPGDGPYYRLLKHDTLYIFDKTSAEFIEQLAAYHASVRALYDQSFGWKLDERMDLILTSPRQQIANAYATVIPNIKTVWFPSGAAVSESFAESSWLLLLDAHEVAHLYQLNAKGRVNAGLKSVIGNSIFFYPFVWRIFIHPNILTPTFIVEGNATFNESRLNMGGRLHSGEKRALVLAQIQAGDIDPTRLINDDFRFPFGEESYMQGAYFQAHLATKHGLEKTNGFFAAQGERYLWPLILNKTFREHFGTSYPQEIREYVRNMEGLAKNQRKAEGPSLIDTTFVGPMNHDQERVFFLTTTAKEPPVLNVYDKRSKTWQKRQLDLLMGKVFWEGDKPLTATSHQHNLRHIEYSLYGENALFTPKFRGQIVTDQRAGKTVALDAAESWLEPKVLLNGENYDISHSHAVLDNSGNVYYFRQNGSERLLIRNREPLTKFDGFYAKPMEVTEDGTFYFIGSTDYGSTLYALRGKEIVRVLDSDRVIDARSLGKGEFMVTEVHNTGHRVLVATENPKSQAPATYSYGFNTQSLIPAAPMPAEEVAKEKREYNSLREMRYSGTDMVLGYSSDAGLSALVNLTFVDPLQYQAIQAAYSGTQFNDQAALVQYTFTKYLPDFFVSYLYEKDEWERIDKVVQAAHDQEVTAGFVMPVLRWKRWDAQFGLGLTYEKNDAHNDPAVSPALDNIEETYGTLTSANLTYSLAPSIGFLPWRYFQLSYTNRLESEANTWMKKYNTSLVQSRYVHGFPSEFYGTLVGNFAWSEYPDIEVQYDSLSLSQDIRIPRLTSHNEEFVAKTAGSLRLEVNKVLPMSLYSARIPIGVNRVAPVVVGQGIFLDDDREDFYPATIFEWGYGADIELLLAHRFPVQIRLLNAYDTRYPQDVEQEARVSYKKAF